MSPAGTILSAQDHGSMWQLVYRRDGNGNDSVYSDHRPFSHFYEGAVDRSFFKDYNCGAGREFISKKLRGLRIRVEGSAFEQVVSLED